MTEKEFVDSISHRTRGWEDLLISGRCDYEKLERGELYDMINRYLNERNSLETYLENLEYEAG